jgi:archaellum component FlaC
LLNNTLNNKNEFSNDSLNLFQKDILSEKTNLKLNPILFSDNLSSNNNINRNINNNYNSNSNSNSNSNRSINSNFDSNNSIFNDNLKNLLSSNYNNDGNSNITNNILDSISINNHDSIEYKPSIGNKDKIRKKKIEEDVLIEKIPVSHILIKMDKLQQLCYNNNKAVEIVNNKCIENSVAANDIKSQLLERIEQGESKIIQLFYNYTEKQKNSEMTWRNEHNDQLQTMQNTMNTLENYIRKFNAKITEQESTIETLRTQLTSNEKRLENLLRDYENQIGNLKQDFKKSNTSVEKQFETIKEELSSTIKNNEKLCTLKYGSLNETLQNEKSKSKMNTDEIKKSLNNLWDIIKNVEEKEIQNINSLKDSINASQSVIATAIKDKETQLREYIEKSNESLTTKINENSIRKQKQITEINEKQQSLSNIMKEKVDTINKQQTKQSANCSKLISDFETKFNNSLQHTMKELLDKINLMEESQKKEEQERAANQMKIDENIQNLEKKCNQDINLFKENYDNKLDETLERYEQNINKSITANDNILEDIKYKIAQLFNKLSSQEEAQETSTRDMNKMIQDIEMNGKKSNIELSQEMNTTLSKLKEQYQAICEKFDAMDEEQKKQLIE